jgi:hypothetical protein
MKTMSEDRFFHRFSIISLVLIDVTLTTGNLGVQRPIF